MKLPYSVACDLVEADAIQVEAGSYGEVVVLAYLGGSPAASVSITPKKARKLAKALKQAADEAEANEW